MISTPALFSVLSGTFVQLFVQAASSGAFTATPSGYVRVLDSSTPHQRGYYAYVDGANDHGAEVPIQFTAERSQAALWWVEYNPIYGGALFGYKDQYYSGVRAGPGSEHNDTAFMAPVSYILGNNETWTLLSQPDAATGQFTMERLPSIYEKGAPIRNLTQLCTPRRGDVVHPSRPVLVLAAQYYPDCSNVTLSWKQLS